MNKNSKIYVAGHRGLVGSAIVKELESRGYNNILKLTSTELDLRNQIKVEELFQSEKPEYVVIAAAKVGGILANNSYKAEFIYDNLAIGINIINSAFKNNVKKLIALGSSCIYPKLSPQPMKEEYLLTGTLEPTNEPYAIAKIAILKMANFYHEQYGSNFYTLMPPNLYGEGDNFNLETSHVLPALIRKVFLAKSLMENDFNAIIENLKKYPIGYGFIISNKTKESQILDFFNKIGIFDNKIELWGTGLVLREFEHSNDFAKATVYSLENINANQIKEFLNVGSGEEISIFDLAYLIKELMDYEGNIEFNNNTLSGTPRKILDNSQALALGIKPQIKLRDGIKQLIVNF